MTLKENAIEEGFQLSRLRVAVNWLALGILMIFYAGTWTFPYFYHITEIYNTAIIFVALAILFFNNVPWLKRLKEGDKLLYCLGITLAIALVNLFLIGSNKGCFLIILDFLLIWYIAPFIRLTGIQRKTYEIFFLLMFISWFLYDRAFSYNSNTGATVTVFTFFGAMVMLQRLTRRKEIFGFFMVISVIRVVTLVLWHLARGAFLALFLFMLFYYFFPGKKWQNKKIFTFFSLFSTLGSLLFVAFYIFLGTTGFNMRLPFFYKNIFSGREQIWLEVWEMLQTRLLTGIGSGFRLRSFFEYNIHNAMYDILAVHGILVFIGALIIILRRLSEIRPRLIPGSREKLCAISALFAIFIESFIDMDLMWADYSPLILFLMLTLYEPEGTKSEN